MKRVMSNAEVAHTWANPREEDDHARSGNMRFQGDTLYSYWAPIARIRPDGIVLITGRNYSNTTNSHIREARSATIHWTSYTLPETCWADASTEEIREECIRSVDALWADLTARDYRRRAQAAQAIGARTDRYNRLLVAIGQEPLPWFDPSPYRADIERYDRTRQEHRGRLSAATAVA